MASDDFLKSNKFIFVLKVFLLRVEEMELKNWNINQILKGSFMREKSDKHFKLN